MIRLRFFALCTLALLPAMPFPCTAQPFVQQIAPFAVTSRTGTPLLLNPFSGGLLKVRAGLRDVDADGLPDLFVLNPDNHLRLYHNEFRTLNRPAFRRVPGSPFDAAPTRDWFRFADIDADGDDDLFTNSERSVVLLYHNTKTQSNPAYTQNPDTLRGQDGQTITSQQLTVPSLVDIDADGDLDLFIGDLSGTITFYENVGTPQAYTFRFRTAKYMDLLIIGGGSAKRGGSTPQHHGASVLDFADLDGDKDPDMFYGDFFTRRLLYFRNDGTPASALFSMNRLDTAFRGMGDLVESDEFNQATAADIDGDGDLDVLVSPLNSETTPLPIKLYRNTGTATAPVMTGLPDAITQEIDVGEYAAPARLQDTTHDGLLVGSIDGSLTYYAITPVNGGRDIAWTESTRFALPGLQQTVPATGDLFNADNQAEVVVGDFEGRLRLYAFNGNSLVRQTWQLDTFQTGLNSSPALADLDKDGDLDLFVGTGGGRFVYFQNIGTPTQPVFERRTPPAPFDIMDVGNNAAPRFFDMNRDGFVDAVVGGKHLTQPGETQTYDTVWVYLNNGSGAFARNPAYPDIAAALSPVPMMMATPRGNYLIIGGQPGGLTAFLDSATTSSVEPDPTLQSVAVRITPNVLSAWERSFTVECPTTLLRPALTICDAAGCVVMQRTFEGVHANLRITLPVGTPGGVYHVLVRAGPYRLYGSVMVWGG